MGGERQTDGERGRSTDGDSESDCMREKEIHREREGVIEKARRSSSRKRVREE